MEEINLLGECEGPEAAQAWSVLQGPSFPQAKPLSQHPEIRFDATRGRSVLFLTVTLPPGPALERLYLVRAIADPKPPGAFWNYDTLILTYHLESDPSDAHIRLLMGLESRGFANPRVYWEVPQDQMRRGVWTEVQLPARCPAPILVRNVYGVGWPYLSVSLQNTGAEPVTVGLRLDTIRIVRDHESGFSPQDENRDKGTCPEEAYRPRVYPRPSRTTLSILILQHAAAAYYRIDQAADQLPVPKRIDRAFYQGLSRVYGFPRTIYALLSYDLLVLVDVDPGALSETQRQMIADFVASGGGLLVTGGPKSFGQIESGRYPQRFARLLPVRMVRGGRLVPVSGPLRLGADHPLTRDIQPAHFGVVRQAHQLMPCSEATALIWAGTLPLLVAGSFGKGRTLVLNTWPAANQTTQGLFSLSSTYQLIMQRALGWLAGRDQLEVRLAEPPGLAEPTPLTIRFHQGRATVGPGARLAFCASLAVPTRAQHMVVRIHDFRGEEVAIFPRRSVRDDLTYTLTVPPWAAGVYTISASLDAGKTLSPVATFQVVDPLEREDFFPLICRLEVEADHLLDEATLRAQIDDILAHGFNTLSLPATPTREASPSRRQRLLIEAEQYAQSRGMALWYEGGTVIPYRSHHPTAACPFDPVPYRRLLEQVLAPRLALARTVPRLLGLKLYDEPRANVGNLHHHPACRAALKEACGGQIPSPGEVPQDLPCRIHFHRFIGEHTRLEFAAVRRCRDEVGGEIPLVLTWADWALGHTPVDETLMDAYRWAPYADFNDFDVYPNWYPPAESPRLRYATLHQVFGYLRPLTRRLGTPLGFYVELDERNYPFSIAPVLASAELAYTALAQGANYLQSFHHTLFGSGSGARPEKWDALGTTLRRIRRIGAVLNRLTSGRSALAVLYPHTHYLATNRHHAPIFGYELFFQAFGTTDVLHEDHLVESGLEGYQSLVLMETTYLSCKAHKTILHFVEQGGLLIWDRVPSYDETGAPLSWPRAFVAAGVAGRLGPWTYQISSWKKGHIVCFATSFHGAYGWLLESGREGTAGALRGDLQALLEHLGLGRSVGSDDPWVEVGRLEGEDTLLLVAVNHSDQGRWTTLRVSDLPFEPAWVGDLTSGRPCPFSWDRATLSVSLGLLGHEGILLVVYPDKMAERLSVEMPAEIGRGDWLYYTVRLHRKGSPCRGIRPLAVRVIDAEGVERPRYGGDTTTIGGVWTKRTRLAVNAAPGLWRIEFEDCLSGLKRVRMFTVRF